MVLDADAINRLSESKEGWKWLKKRVGSTWITPHFAEFKRLFPFIDCSNPLNAAIEASQISGTSILLKCAHSIIADPSGKAWQIGESNPFAARAGLGDLLAGFVTGMGSLGLVSNQKLETDLLAASALLHSQAAISCPEGTSASLIAKQLSTLVKVNHQGKCDEKNNN